MLGNGLGEVLKKELKVTKRFFDLFSGSGAVSSHVATKYNVPVFAFDLQHFSVVLTNSTIARTDPIQVAEVWEGWCLRALQLVKNLNDIPKLTEFDSAFVQSCREWSSRRRILPITKAYGGHYFSPTQTLWIDALRKSLPEDVTDRTAALSALVQAASQCAASPGHTAQPFQPTETAIKYIADSWSKDILKYTKNALCQISEQKARVRGFAQVMDANLAVEQVEDGDLVFIDPPYSGVHYSRFYHVLETIADGNCGEVTGVGRYPDKSLRPFSEYSVKKGAATALADLFRKASTNNARAIVTFPDHECSNGLSGSQLIEIADQYFKIKNHVVKSKFSTLGGSIESGGNRAARVHANELILVLTPK